MYYKKIKRERPVPEADVRQLQRPASAILQRFKKEENKPPRHYEKKFDRFEPESPRVSRAGTPKAKDKLPPEIIAELDFSISRVPAFAQV